MVQSTLRNNAWAAQLQTAHALIIFTFLIALAIGAAEASGTDLAGGTVRPNPTLAAPRRTALPRPADDTAAAAVVGVALRIDTVGA